MILTRDSVCEADDCDAPHEKAIKIYSFTDPVAPHAADGDWKPSIRSGVRRDRQPDTRYNPYLGAAGYIRLEVRFFAAPHVIRLLLLP